MKSVPVAARHADGPVLRRSRPSVPWGVSAEFGQCESGTARYANRKSGHVESVANLWVRLPLWSLAFGSPQGVPQSIVNSFSARHRWRCKAWRGRSPAEFGKNVKSLRRSGEPVGTRSVQCYGGRGVRGLARLPVKQEVRVQLPSVTLSDFWRGRSACQRGHAIAFAAAREHARRNRFTSLPAAVKATLPAWCERVQQAGCDGLMMRRGYLTRTNFIMRPETFQSWTYKLPSLSQYDPWVPLKMPSIHWS